MTLFKGVGDPDCWDCTWDGVCDPDCQGDPDCIPCGLDDFCDPDCPSDPDCEECAGGDECNLDCKCDPDCGEERLGFKRDGICDPQCAVLDTDDCQGCDLNNWCNPACEGTAAFTPPVWTGHVARQGAGPFLWQSQTGRLDLIFPGQTPAGAGLYRAPRRYRY